MEAIDITLKIIALTERLHENSLVHTNIAPNEIILENGELDQMRFANLYYASWTPKKIFGVEMPGCEETINKFDIRTRNKDYISPEQLNIGKQLEDMAAEHNGKILHDSADVKDLMNTSQEEITNACDIYAIGAILHMLLIGEPPSPEISSYIELERLHQDSPTHNVYQVPYFLRNRILSNDMCYILVKLLHKKPRLRYINLETFKQDLLKLRRNIFKTPKLLRQVLGHPVLP